MILDEVKVNNAQYSHKFYLNCGTKTGAIGKGAATAISGKVVEKGADFVRVRQSSAYREHNDIVIPLASICYFSESYSAE